VPIVCGTKIWKLISTRENENFRNNIIPIGTTSMSAGSKTNPGGYVVDPQSLEQFEISDERSAQEIATYFEQRLRARLDWDRTLVECQK
jgi:2-iminoacetate synthase